MDQERWIVVKELVADALDFPEDQRIDFITKRVGGDDNLRGEALRLLFLYGESSPQLLRESIWRDVRAEMWQAEEQPSLEPGRILCERFLIDRFIARGGMGEVYAAFDRELRDVVAVKLIRSGQAGDEAVERFRLEVSRSIKISHPNVCRVRDLFQHQDDAGALRFLTMEFLDGGTLATELKMRGKLRGSNAADISRQVAAGLAAAHANRIVHRDLKPGNIMLVPARPGTRAVVMDFGLAQLYGSSDENAHSDGRSGTPAYMAPEQRTSGLISPASDVYSFGIVVRELLDAGELKKRVPGCSITWQALIARCTAEDPSQRFTSASEVQAVLEPGVAAAARLRRYTFSAVTVALLAGALLVASVIWRDEKLELGEPVRLSQYSGLTTSAAISRSGNVIAYSSDEAQEGNFDIWVRRRSEAKARRLTFDTAEDMYPTVSPDEQWVAYRSERGAGGLYAFHLASKREQFLVSGGLDPVFSPRGLYLAWWTGESMNMSVTGSKAFYAEFPSGHPLQIHPEFADVRHPVWSPDARSILFQGVKEKNQPPDSFAEWYVMDLASGKTVSTGLGARLRSLGLRTQLSGVAWWRDILVFSTTAGEISNLWYVPISSDGQVTSSARRLGQGSEHQALPSVSANGDLAFSTARSVMGTWMINLANRVDSPTLVSSSAGNDTWPAVSRTGDRLFFRRRIFGYRNIWMKDLRSGSEIVLTDSAVEKLQPTPNSDGSVVAYSEAGTGLHAVFMVNTTDRRITHVCNACGQPQDWSRAGDHLLVASGLDGTVQRWFPGRPKPSIVLSSERYLIDSVRYSPDEKRIVFSARADGSAHVFVAPVTASGVPSEEQWLRVSPEQAWSDTPIWGDDGSAIYYRSKPDGFYCLYEARMRGTSVTTTAIQHFHSARLALDGINRSGFNLAKAHGRLFFTGADVRGSIWLSRLQAP